MSKSTVTLANRDSEDVLATGTTLNLLHNVERDSSVTQRSLATDLGIALGLANVYLKRCVRKGWIKVSQVPARRYAYYLTPKGFAEKSRLTAEFLSVSFGFFREARDSCTAAFEGCESRGLRRVLLVGAGELAEVASIAAAETGVELVGILDKDTNHDSIVGLPVFRTLQEVGPVDAVLVTSIRDPQAVYDALAAKLPEDRILTPPMLRVTRRAEAAD